MSKIGRDVLGRKSMTAKKDRTDYIIRNFDLAEAVLVVPILEGSTAKEIAEYMMKSDPELNKRQIYKMLSALTSKGYLRKKGNVYMYTDKSELLTTYGHTIG